MSGESDTLWLTLAGFMAAGCKTQPELGRQSGSDPRFVEPNVRDSWIGRLNHAYQMKAPQTDFVLHEVLFRQVASVGCHA